MGVVSREDRVGGAALLEEVLSPPPASTGRQGLGAYCPRSLYVGVIKQLPLGVRVVREPVLGGDVVGLLLPGLGMAGLSRPRLLLGADGVGRRVLGPGLVRLPLERV
jgi:hypothetical protein